jgi:SAM-dependent methyltransferase
VSEAIFEHNDQYYSQRIRQHGATPAGVDWNGATSQNLRFEQFHQLWRKERSFSLNDLGCGYAALYGYLRQRHFNLDYYGIDLSAEMIEAARKRYGEPKGFNLVHGRQPSVKADYTVASGLFNTRGDIDSAAWYEYMLATVRMMASFSTRGFAFNVLSLHSDEEKRQPHLFYADPAALVSFCWQNGWRKLHLAQDSGLWEFTLSVRF